MTELKKEIQEKQKEIVAWYESIQDRASFEDSRLAFELLHSQKTLLNKSGYIKPREQTKADPNKAPNLGIFKKKEFIPGDLPKIPEIDNKKPNFGIFKRKNVEDDLEDVELAEVGEGLREHDIENVNPQLNRLKKKALPVLDKLQKDNPKRLSQTHVKAIKKLIKDGLNSAQISDELNIVEPSIARYIDSLQNNNKTLLATSGKGNKNGESIKEYHKNNEG